jgi:hypothetical protein
MICLGATHLSDFINRGTSGVAILGQLRMPDATCFATNQQLIDVVNVVLTL